MLTALLSLGEMAILKAMSRKVSRFKAIVHHLKEHLDGRAYRGMDMRHDVTVEKGWAAMKCARY